MRLADQAVALDPQVAAPYNTLGVVCYRAGNWPAAIESLRKSMELSNGGSAFDWFFLAMAHAQLGQLEDAREWYQKAEAWMCEPQRCKNSSVRRTAGPSIVHGTVLHFASARFHETCDLSKIAEGRPGTQTDGPPAPSC